MTLEREQQEQLQAMVAVLRAHWNVLCPNMVTLLRDDVPRSNVDIDADLETLEEQLMRTHRAVRAIRMMWRQ